MIYTYLRKLAKDARFQNLFTIAKEFHNFTLFRNKKDLSNLQELFINYLFMYDAINRDVINAGVSPHVFDCELYEEAYLAWKKEKGNKIDTQENNKPSELKLVASDKISFPDKKA